MASFLRPSREPDRGPPCMRNPPRSYESARARMRAPVKHQPRGSFESGNSRNRRADDDDDAAAFFRHREENPKRR